MDKFTLGIISRERPELVQQAVNSAWANSNFKEHLEILTLFDADFKSAYLTQNMVKAPLTLAVTNLRHYYVRAANELLSIINTDRFVFTNDDSVFLPGWDEQAHKALNSLGGDGIIELGGEPFKCAHFITTKEYINRVNMGVMGYPGYTFYCSDTELMFKALHDGTYRWLNPGVIKHNVVEDAVRSECVYWLKRDRKMWEVRKVLLGLTEGHPEPDAVEITL